MSSIKRVHLKISTTTKEPHDEFADLQKLTALDEGEGGGILEDEGEGVVRTSTEDDASNPTISDVKKLKPG